MNTIEEIKNQLDIVDVVSETVKLRRSGKNYTGFCPFHANTRTPAFVVFPDTGTWRCFGECNEGGDIYRYVMKKEGVDFKEALKMLADRAGIQLEPLTPQKAEQNEREEFLRKILEETVIYYRHQMLNTPAGQAANQYLREKRGITDNTAEVWGLGYAPRSWDALISHFKAKGYLPQDLIDAGLVSQRDNGDVYDRFRHRLMIPIRDMSGKMTGFGGRVLDPDDVPKFMNSPQTALFDKSALLFGMDRARKAIRAQGQAVIVEGYFDVIVPHQEGFENVISPMGTALTEVQMRQLKRFTRNFILALDPDAAGQKATLRGLEVARGALDHDSDPVFDARGLLHNESRLKADLRVSTLPDDLDPDEIVLRDPKDWEDIVASARPIIYHVLDSLSEGQDTEDPKVKRTIAAQVLPLINDVADPVERDAYRQHIARTLKIDERALMDSRPTANKRRSSRRQITRAGQSVEKSSIFSIVENQKVLGMEKEVLAYLSEKPETIFKIDLFLRSNGLDAISAEDFRNTENQVAADVILASMQQEALDPVDYIKSKNIIIELERNPDLTENGEDNDEPGRSEIRHLEETVRLIMQLRQMAVNREINDIRFLQSEQEKETEEEKNDLRADPHTQKKLITLIKARGLLDRALSKPIVIE